MQRLATEIAGRRRERLRQDTKPQAFAIQNEFIRRSDKIVQNAGPQSLPPFRFFSASVIATTATMPNLTDAGKDTARGLRRLLDRASVLQSNPKASEVSSPLASTRHRAALIRGPSH